MNIAKLKELLSQEWNNLDEKYIKDKFDELADIFLKKVIIEKGKLRYWITDIEFYLYTPSHRDIITYPRNCDAGQWFFHSSGVDISFESKVETAIKEKSKKRMAHLTEDSFFGGILIKGIKQVSKDGKTIVDFNGPQIACFELFDMFDAFGDVSNFPKLSIYNTERNCIIKSAPRHNLLPKDKTAELKVASILANNYGGSDIGEAKLVEAFDNYKGAEYRFYV